MTKPVITTRITKGEPLTFGEMDSNLTNLQNATLSVAGDSGTTQALDLNDTLTIAGGTGLSTVASATDTITINLDNTAVTAGSYTKASITVNAQGQITAASNGSADFTQSDARQSVSVTDSGGDGSLSYNNSTGVFTYTGPSASEVRAHFSAGTGISITNGSISTSITQYTDSAARSAVSVTDSGGDGSLSYNSSTGVITYTGPSASEVRAHFSAGSGITITDGVVATSFTAENSANKGQANGYASLDSGGKVPSTQLPSYVDDVVESANFAALPGTGETSKIYVTLDNNKIYRWSGSAYVEISASPGSTDAVTEGSTNLYFTTQRARDAFSASTGITITNGAIATTITQYTDSLARAAISVTDSGGDGSLSYNSSTGVITYTGPSASEVRAHFSAGTGITITNGAIATTITQYADSNARSAISVTDSGGDGSLSYNSTTGVITYTGPSASEVRAHFSAGTGISYNSSTGVISNTQTAFDPASPGAIGGTTPNTGAFTTVSASTTGTNGAINVTYTPSTTSGSAIQASGKDSQGGVGYFDFLKVTNTTSGATNANKTFRTNSTGALEIINSAYGSTILSLTDAGVLSANLSGSTVDGTNGVGFRGVPSAGSEKTTSYTLTTADRGEYVQVGSGGSITVPNSTFSQGDVVVIYNNHTAAITITLSTTNAYIAGTNTNKTSVSLATRGVCNILFISSTVAILTGNIT